MGKKRYIKSALEKYDNNVSETSRKIGNEQETIDQ